MEKRTDFLVIGTGLAGLSFALKVASLGKVILVSKVQVTGTNTWWAQGGIASVIGKSDTFEKHVQDTLEAGAGLCRQEIVENFIRQGPDRIQELIAWGVPFDRDSTEDLHLTREAAHSENRVIHVKDYTGRAIGDSLLEHVRRNPNIEILENNIAIDLITNKKVTPTETGPTRCLGAYVYDAKTDQVTTIVSGTTVLATGGAGKIYLYTSNWDGATGDGIGMAYRAGARVGNLEFMQFHPTCLYHPSVRNFLISEAVRGEGGELVNAAGHPFMKGYHKLGSLAPRDVVAKSIDAEMKKTGADCVYIDIRDKTKEFLQERFPVIYRKCAELGIFMEKDLIPVVPAAHYLCGGILADQNGLTDIQNLFAIGETSLSGLHGANRLASNSLLECVAMAHNASEYIKKNLNLFSISKVSIPEWKYSHTHDADELVVISHMWDEIRRLMWNYVGIVRSNKRLERAEHRLENLMKEIQDYYWNFKLHPDVLELRNLALVAHLTVKCALKRKESRGIHFNLDCPETAASAQDTIL